MLTVWAQHHVLSSLAVLSTYLTSNPNLVMNMRTVFFLLIIGITYIQPCKHVSSSVHDIREILSRPWSFTPSTSPSYLTLLCFVLSSLHVWLLKVGIKPTHYVQLWLIKAHLNWNIKYDWEDSKASPGKKLFQWVLPRYRLPLFSSTVKVVFLPSPTPTMTLWRQAFLWGCHP